MGPSGPLAGSRRHRAARGTLGLAIGPAGSPHCSGWIPQPRTETSPMTCGRVRSSGPPRLAGRCCSSSMAWTKTSGRPGYRVWRASCPRWWKGGRMYWWPAVLARAADRRAQRTPADNDRRRSAAAVPGCARAGQPSPPMAVAAVRYAGAQRSTRHRHHSQLRGIRASVAGSDTYEPPHIRG